MKKIFFPESYSLEDKPNKNFIDPSEIRNILNQFSAPTKEQFDEVIEKSLQKKRLSLQEVAVLVNASEEWQIKKIKQTAKDVKKVVYGNRIVIFAPLYVGNRCTNNCTYCGFSSKNLDIIRKTLTHKELRKETKAMLDDGHKRTILVFGEHPDYSPEFIADSVREVYSVKSGNGEMRRININAAPFDVEGFRTIKESGIGTYQVFQETYDPELYAQYHLNGQKSNYEYRLLAFDRAMEAGIDDVGIGALLGLGDWRFEILSLVRHTNHLEACFGVGPHTISFPRIKETSNNNGVVFDGVSDEDFMRLVAILRLAVPYTGLILTAREPKEIRDEIMSYGVSQIDGGTNIEIGGYSNDDAATGQFQINDQRTLSEVMDELIEQNYLPSFCTACYRKGRTGEHFMEFSVPGFIKRYCTPNAIFTLAEYLEDYASEETRENGYKLIEKEIKNLEASKQQEIEQRVQKIRNGERDLLY